MGDGPAPARVHVEWVGGRVRLTELRASRYQQVRPLSVDGTTVRIALVGTYARLRWRAAPLVITAGADLDREMSVDLDGDARALISELLVLGRSYEPGGGPLRSRMRVHQGARPLLVEDLDLRDRARRADPGVLGGARTLASVFLLGARPGEAVGRHETLLAGDGAISRVLASQAHLTEDPVDRTWARWAPILDAPTASESPEGSVAAG